jgi:hypothetical protein
MPSFPARDFTNQYISRSYQDVVQQYIDGGPTDYLLDGYGNVIFSFDSASYGSKLITTQETNSIVVISSSYALSSSWADSSLSAAYAPGSPSISSSYALSASYAVTASYSNTSTSASHANNADIALYSNYAEIAGTSSLSVHSDTSDTASVAISASYALSSSFASRAITSSYSDRSISASYADRSTSSSYAETASVSISSSYALTASYAVTSSFSSRTISSSYADRSITSSYAETALSAAYAPGSPSVSSSYALSASYAVSASYLTGSNAISTIITSSNIGTVKGDNSLTLFTSGSPQVTISGSGAVGIGAAPSDFRLEITTGDTSGLSIVNTDTPGIIAGAGISGFSSTIPTSADQRLGFYTLGAKDSGANRNAVGIFGFSSQAWTSNSIFGSYMTFATVNDNSSTRTEKMRLTSDGRLGIGTTIPIQKLDVSGSANFTGSITASGAILSTDLVIPFIGVTPTGAATKGTLVYNTGSSFLNMYDGTTWKSASFQLALPSTTYFVNTTGSNSNNGLSAATPFQTIQFAINTVQVLTGAPSAFTIQISPGTYAENLIIAQTYANSTITLVANPATTNTAVVINSSTGDTITIKDSFVILQSLRFVPSGSGTRAVVATNRSQVTVTSCSFASSTDQTIYSLNKAIVTVTDNTCTGGSQIFYFVDSNANLVLSGKQNFIGSSSFSNAFIYAWGMSLVSTTATWTNTGSITGRRYVVDENSLVRGTAAAANYFPGNSAGTTLNGGLYT